MALLTVNPDLNLVVEQPLSRQRLASVDLPRGPKVPIWVQFARDGAVIDPSEALTSGTLVVGLYYKITTFVTSDDFTNVGAASNATGVYFLCTGTTPTTWTHGSTLQQCDSTGVLFSLIFSVKKNGEYDGAVLVLATGTDFTKFGTGTTTIFKSKCSFSTAEINLLLGVDSSVTNDESEVTLMGEISWLGPDESKAFPFQISLQNDSYKTNDVVTSTPGVQAMSLVTTTAEALLTGSRVLTAGTNISISVSGGAVTISSTASSGLTVNTTTVSGASAGDILISDGTKAQKLTPGTGVTDALGNAVNATDGLVTFDGEIGAAGAESLEFPGLNGSVKLAAYAATGAGVNTISFGANASALIFLNGNFQVNANAEISGTNTGDQTTVTGNAGTATALTTTRTIGGSNFNGSANVTSFPTPGAIGGTTPDTIAGTTFTGTSFNGLNVTLGGGAVSSNVAIGALALNANSAGTGLVAIGNGALQRATGSSNIGIGTSAAAFITTATESVAIGAAAMGAGNFSKVTAIGVFSCNGGGGNTTTALGYYAGYATSGTGGAGGLFLGAYAGKYEVADNVFLVNNQDRTDTATEHTKSLLYGTFASAQGNQQLTANVGTFSFSNASGSGTITLATTNTTVALFNTSATTVNAFQAGTNIGIGANTGTLTLSNANVTIKGAISAFSSLTLGTASSTAGTVVLKNATSTGTTTIANANVSSSSYTFTVPAVTGTAITTGDTGTVTNTMLAGSIDLTTKVTGALPQANIAALTGDVTKPSGSGVTTLANIPAISGANLTSLNSANITASTTNALGIGTIELGHASDTTLSRSAAGTLAVEGVDVLTTSGTQTLTNKSIVATQLTGTLADARNTVSNTTTTSMANLATVGTLTGGATGAGFTVALSTSTITGSLADARLSANVPLLNASNTFTGATNSFTISTTTGTTTTSGIAITANSLTSGTALNLSSNTTAAAAGSNLLNISASGTNATSAITTTAATIANIHAGTTSTNVALTLTASGGTTANTALNVTAGQIIIPVGSAASPSIRWSDSTNTGLYSVVTGYTSFAGSGTECLRVASSGVSIYRAFDCTAAVSFTNTLAVTGNTTLGTGTAIKNIRHGVSGAMVLGVVTVTDTGCTANTRYSFTQFTQGTITVPSAYWASTRTASTSFVITSSQLTETGTVHWKAIEP